MLKRNDLAKQFELVVQQEIINHNEQILESNLSINSLREDLTETKINVEKNHNEFISTRENHRSYLATLKMSIDDISQDVKSLNINFKKRFDATSHQFIDASFSLEKLSTLLRELKVKQEDLEKKIIVDSIKSDSLKEDLQCIINAHVKVISKTINDIFNEVSKTRSTVDPIKKELCEKVDSANVDIKCLREEIELLKRSSFVKDKHIEYLLTQIERIKAG